MFADDGEAEVLAGSLVEIDIEGLKVFLQGHEVLLWPAHYQGYVRWSLLQQLHGSLSGDVLQAGVVDLNVVHG